MFTIHSIDIERWDDRAYCGILEYCGEEGSATLLWTVEWRDTPEVLVEFFPGNEFEDVTLIHYYQELLISSLLDTLSERMGRETLFT